MTHNTDDISFKTSTIHFIEINSFGDSEIRKKTSNW
jgi:hypothetical protein